MVVTVILRNTAKKKDERANPKMREKKKSFPWVLRFQSERASAVRVVLRAQIACDMICGSIYRCYGIIPTIKELFHRPGDLRLASQDTENDLMATSFTPHAAPAVTCQCARACECVCEEVAAPSHSCIFRKHVGAWSPTGESGGPWRGQ